MSRHHAGVQGGSAGDKIDACTLRYSRHEVYDVLVLIQLLFSALQRLVNGNWLLVDLLEHEVRVVAAVSDGAVQLQFLHFTKTSMLKEQVIQLQSRFPTFKVRGDSQNSLIFQLNHVRYFTDKC